MSKQSQRSFSCKFNHEIKTYNNSIDQNNANGHNNLKIKWKKKFLKMV